MSEHEYAQTINFVSPQEMQEQKPSTHNTRTFPLLIRNTQCVPFTLASSRFTSGLPSYSFLPACLGLDSGLGISMVFDRLGRKGIGVDGLEERNYT